MRVLLESSAYNTKLELEILRADYGLLRCDAV